KFVLLILSMKVITAMMPSERINMNTEKFEHEKKHESKPKNIIVNARPKSFEGDRITYSEVVDLAFSGSVDSDVVYTVSYVGPKTSDGTLVEGQSVAIRNGVKFDVIKTNRS
ncbi:hypothetical protein CYQ88_11395, partial [Hydrogenovibrio sp. SC-1]|uniref:multiubiquitin domain-containing protein n=1 Tax=Hydrogenovibrio sp. SC-1 TaxID=2065820 RepID=UPI000C7CC24F